MVNEHNIINSFRLVKSDIISVQGELLNIKEQQARMMIKLEEISSKLISRIRTQIKPVQVMPQKTKVITKTSRKIFVASKESNKFHISHCPFAQNIKPKTKIIFKSKNTALNKGYKPCKCV
ncbi:MAG: hypothetical protein ABIF88_01450 [archaeon]